MTDSEDRPRPADSPSGTTAPGHLPRRLTPFFGREELVGRIVADLTEPATRLLTLTGPGGVGKTRLALHVAEVSRPLFANGTVFVSLAPVVDPALVLPAIAAAIELAEGGERPIADRLADALAERALLLVLDNLEQVIAVAPELAALLRATAGVTILATSQARLHVEGEREVVVPPLALPTPAQAPAMPGIESEAVLFFLDRARAANPTLTLSPSGAAAVLEIVRRLEGLPLALELAAARTKVLSPEALLARLVRQLDVLTGGARDGPARQQTMRQAVAWSYGLLEPAGQALVRQLAVFRGGFGLEEAESILTGVGDVGPATGSTAGAPLDLLDGVSTLVDQSLVVPAASDTGRSEGARFRMLETIREFALEQLAVAGEVDAVQRRFAAHWIALAEASWAHTSEMEHLNKALAPLEHSQDNVRAALDWLEDHDPGGAAALAGALFWFWYVRGQHAEAARRLLRILALPEDLVPDSLRPRLCLGAGMFLHFQSRTDEAVPLLEAALAGWRSAGDAWGTGFTLLALGIIAEDTERYDRAGVVLAEAIERLEAAGDTGSVGTARYHLAVVALGGGDVERAGSLVAEVIGDGDGTGVRIAAWAIHLRGLVAHARGDYGSALRDFQLALSRFQEARYPAGVEDAMAGVAITAAAVGLPVGVRLWAVAERMSHERGDGFQQPERDIYAGAIARLRARLGDLELVAEQAAGRILLQDEAVVIALALELPPNSAASGRTIPLSVLSDREREVLRLVAIGWSNDRIGGELFLSPRTVQSHLTRIFRKIDATNRTEAARIAVDSGLT